MIEGVEHLNDGTQITHAMYKPKLNVEYAAIIVCRYQDSIESSFLIYAENKLN
jgi:hypothetical protein